MEIKDQPAPDGGQGNVQALVRADLEERERIGVERYGTPLRLFNGRNALVDAYQEAMDLTVYLRQAIAERNLSSFSADLPWSVTLEALAAAERATSGAEDVIDAVRAGVFAAAPFIAAAAVRSRVEHDDLINLGRVARDAGLDVTTLRAVLDSPATFQDVGDNANY